MPHDSLKRICRRANAPAFFAGVLVVLSLAATLVSCGKNIDNSVVQLQKDREKIAVYLDAHCLTPAGDIVPLSEVPAVAASGEESEGTTDLPEGYVLLSDTAKSIGNMYIVHLAEGAGDRIGASDRALIRYSGYYLDDMQMFDSTWDDEQPYALWVSGAIEGVRDGLLAMKTGIIDSETPEGYADPGQAWLILPSTMAFGQEGRVWPVVPSNMCVIYRINLYSIALENY